MSNMLEKLESPDPSNVHVLIERLAAALTRTSWRCELGAVDGSWISAAEERFGPLPDDYKTFLTRVVLLENHAGDVSFFTARDLADPQSDLARLFDGWRRADQDAVRSDAAALAEVRAFWDGIVPVLCSTVNGDDFLAIDRTRGGGVIEAWGEQGWSEGTRQCATSFAHFLAALVSIAESGTAALECGWRLGRKAIQALHGLDANYREPLVPIFFVTDFDAAAPPRRTTRPRLVARR